jgi:outer membrane immunogenic protein
MAADLPVKAPAVEVPSWTGFYLGAYAGGAWGRSNANTSVDCSATTIPPAYLCGSGPVAAGGSNASAVNAAGTGTITATGFTGGVEAGYNVQADRFVYGLETDFGAMHLRGARQGNGTYPVGLVVIPGAPFAVSSSFSTDWLFTLRGRVGWTAAPSVLAYATGGLAVTRLGVNNSFADLIGGIAPGSESTNSAATKAGLAVGGGLEWMVNLHWTVKAEYLFVDFGKVATTGFIANPAIAVGYAQGISTSSDLSASIARAGVNYKF